MRGKDLPKSRRISALVASAAPGASAAVALAVAPPSATGGELDGLVISTVYTAGGAGPASIYNEDFVVLFNSGRRTCR